MTTYAENSKLKRSVITLADGSMEYLKNCKLINGKYYRVPDQCVVIDRRWYGCDDPRIFYNHATKNWETRLFKIIKLGVVDLKEDGSIITGEYTEDLCRNCKIGIIKDGVKHIMDCISFEIPKKKGFIEHLNDPIWISDEFMNSNFDYAPLMKCYPHSTILKLHQKVNEFSNPNKLKMFSFPENSYNAEESKEFEKAIKNYNDYSFNISKRVRKAAKLLGDITFGAEIETKMGNLPTYYQSQLGIVICKDGSIGYTPEFVTVPYTGAKGLHSLNTLFTELNKRCTTDQTCSLHYHIGTIRKDREFLVALWILYSHIQRDLHAMLPYYKTDPSGVKSKNYCEFLNSDLFTCYLKDTKITHQEKVNKCYYAIYNWILEGTNPSKTFNRKSKRHPNGSHKWNLHSRYFSLNYLNMFTSNRSTMEFRAHHAVLHPTKAINWLFICTAIIRYAEKHSAKIIKNFKIATPLSEVLNYYGDTFKTPYAISVSNYLKDYYIERVMFFSNLRNTDDAIAKKDFTQTEYSLKGSVLDSII